MALQYVQPGQKITAEGYNSLVDVASGAGNSSSEGFVNTGNGSVFYPRAQLNTKYYNGAWRTMFQVVPARYWKQTTRGQWNPPEAWTTLLIDLGADAASCKKNVTVRGKSVEDGCVVVGASQSLDALVDDDLYLNASEEKTPWIDLGIEADDTSFVALDLFSWEEEEEEGKYKDPIYYFAITDKGYEEYDERAKNILGVEGNGIWKSLRRFMLNKKGASQYGEDHETQIQEHSGAISWSDPVSADQLSVDSAVPPMMLSSIEFVSCEISTTVSAMISGEISSWTETKELNNILEIYDFSNAGNWQDYNDVIEKENETHEGSEEESAPKRADVLIRYGKETDQTSATGQVEYVALSSFRISCDTYFTEEATKSKSLDIIQSENGVDMQELYNFRDGQPLDKPPEKYHVLIRKNDEENSTKSLEYINPTDIYLVDTEISSLKQQSIEKKTNPEDADEKYIQLYNFDDDQTDAILSIDKYDHLLPDGYTLLVRHISGDNRTLEYADLSIDLGRKLSADTEMETPTTKSIDVKDDVELLLHDFDGTDKIDTEYLSTHIDEIEILVRDRVGAANELKYAGVESLSACMLSGISSIISSIISSLSNDISGDTQISDSGTSSIVLTSNEAGQKFYRVKGFDGEQCQTWDEISAHSENYDVLLRHKLENAQNDQYEMRYANISALLSGASKISVDSELSDQFSLEFNNDEKYYQLYHFDKVDAEPISIILGKQVKMSDKQYQILVRNNDEHNGKVRLEYAQLCVDTGISVDSDLSDQMSIEFNKEEDFYQLYDFDKVDKAPISICLGPQVKMTDKQYQILVRNNDTDNDKVRLEYAQLCVDNRISVDSDLSDQFSIEFKKDEDYYQLWEFDTTSASLSITLGNGEDCEKKLDDNYQILVRSKDSGKNTLEYASLCIEVSAMSADSSDPVGGGQCSSIELIDDKYISLYRFNSEDKMPIADLSSNDQNIEFLVKDRTSGKVLKYVNAEDLTKYWREDISGDSQIRNTDTSSIVVLSSSAGREIMVKGFDGQAALPTSTVSANTAAYDVLLRYKNSNKYDMQYVNISALLSGSALSGDELRKPRKNWDWPTQVNSETGKTEYCPPGTGTLYGYYFKGYQYYSYSATLPAQPEGKTILVISGLYSSYGAAYAWTDSYPSKTLSTWYMPLYVRYNSPDNGPTFDYNAGMFTIPTYY